MEEIVGAYAAAVLTVAIAHELAPSVFGSYFVNALAGRSGADSAGRYGESLYDYIVSAGFIFAVNNGGLAACVNHYIKWRNIIGILYVFDVFRLILGRLDGSGGSCRL